MDGGVAVAGVGAVVGAMAMVAAAASAVVVVISGTACAAAVVVLSVEAIGRRRRFLVAGV